MGKKPSNEMAPGELGLAEKEASVRGLTFPRVVDGRWLAYDLRTHELSPLPMMSLWRKAGRKRERYA